MKKGFIYARQSSGDEEQSLSIEVQVANCADYAKKNEIEIKGIFRDANISGRCYPVGAEKVAERDKVFSLWWDASSKNENKKYRSGLGELIARLENDDVIIIDDLTRLMRPLQSSFLESYINQALIGKNVIVHTCKGGLIDASKFNDNLISTLQNLIESQAILIRIQKANASRKKMKNDGFAPNGKTMLGYKNCGYQRYEVIEEEANIVRRVFELAAEGLTFSQISKMMKSSFDLINRKAYTNGMIIKLLRRAEYCGLCYDLEENLIESKIFANIPLIDKKLFFAVAEILKIRKGIANRDKKRSWPVSGLVFCPVCNRRMVLTKPIHKGRRVSQYYLCRPISETKKHSSVRYNDTNNISSINFAPIKVGEVLKDGFFKRFGANAGVTVQSDKDHGVGLFTAIYPLIFKTLADDVSAKLTSNEVFEEEFKIKNELEKIEKLEKKLGAMLLAETIDDAQFKNVLSDSKIKKKLLLEDFHKLESKKIMQDDDTLSEVIYKSINGQLKDHEIKLLFQKVIDKIYSFDSYIQVTLTDGKSFNLNLENVYRNFKHQSSFPNWKAKIVVKNGVMIVQVVYFSGVESVLYNNENFQILTK